MKKGILSRKNGYVATFTSLITILTAILFLSPNSLNTHASFLKSSSEMSAEELHAKTVATTVRNDKPAITFFTHGYGMHAGNWSNKMYQDGNNWTGSPYFDYDAVSIIEKIRNQQPNGIKLYVARMDIKAVPYLFNKDRFYLFEYIRDSEFIPTKYEPDSILRNEISDFSLHTVVVFDLLHGTDKTNAEVYQELDYIIDKISYDYYAVMKTLPNINLIGHSRGGLHNMDYAINHPKNVASLISIGTPYNGSWYDNWFVELIGFDDFKEVGGQDIVDPVLISERKNNWNNVYAQNPHINFHAISATTSIKFLDHVVWDDGHLDACFSQIITTEIRAAYLFYKMTTPVAGLLFFTLSDICVDYLSQSAGGYSGLTNSRFNKDFTVSNSNCDKRATSDPPLPHNLQTYDSDIHNYILSNVTFAAAYDTTSLVGNKVRIENVNFTIKGAFNVPTTLYGMTVTEIGIGAFASQDLMTNISIPNSITYIGDFAFAWCDMLKTIVIPDKITRIEPGVFYRCIGLTTVVIKGVITNIYSDAFLGCLNLSSINLPHGLKTIEDYAFSDCSKLTSITIPSSVTKIGRWAFTGCNDINMSWPSNTDTLNPQLYGYPNEYDFCYLDKEINTINGGSIVTRRLRAGYIYGNGYSGQRYLALSAKTADAGTAYLEYYFVRYVTKIDYQLALWSASESLIMNSSIRLEFLDDGGGWSEARTFYANSMSTDKDDLWDYQTTFPVSTKAFRFIIETNQVQNNNNKGRMVIGNIDISYA